MANQALPCPTVLRLLLRYEPETGKLFWKNRARGWFKGEKSYLWWNKRFAGKEACNHPEPMGYSSGTILGRKVLTHRAVFLMCMGYLPHAIDHQNGVRNDNRMENLRGVAKGENNRNAALSRKNTSGVCGVYKTPQGKWCAQIKVNGRAKNLGTFVAFDDAVAVRKNAERQFGYHPNHGRPEEERAQFAKPSILRPCRA